MNERIVELADRAGFVLWKDEDWKPKDAVIDWACGYDVELEKFVELVVRRCNVLYENGYTSEQIRKTFGIE